MVLLRGGGGQGGPLAHSRVAVGSLACSSGWRSRPPPWWTTVDSLASIYSRTSAHRGRRVLGAQPDCRHRLGAAERNAGDGCAPAAARHVVAPAQPRACATARLHGSHRHHHHRRRAARAVDRQTTGILFNVSTVGCAMSRRPASPRGCSVHSAGLGLRTRPLGGRRRLPAIADSPSGIGEPGGARAPRARAPYPRGRSFRANICDFLAPAPPHAIPRLRGLPSTKLLLQQDALHDRPGTAGAAPPGCVSTRRRPLRGGPSTHPC
eukprot:COSAG06_NODE_5916_length_3211_cov_8.185090_2_plen_265_part_00